MAKLEEMLVMHCITKAVLEYRFYLQIPSANCSIKQSLLYNNQVDNKKPSNFVSTNDFIRRRSLGARAEYALHLICSNMCKL